MHQLLFENEFVKGIYDSKVIGCNQRFMERIALIEFVRVNDLQYVYVQDSGLLYLNYLQEIASRKLVIEEGGANEGTGEIIEEAINQGKLLVFVDPDE